MPSDELKTALIHALATVRDPENGRDLVAAGLIEEIEIDLPRVKVALALVAASDARRAQVAEGVEHALHGIPGVQDVEVVFVRAGAGTAPPAAPASGPKRLPMAGGGPKGAAPGAPGPGGPGGGGAMHGQGTSGRLPIPGVKHLIAVASGKGGVGKSTVCVNLALALGHLGVKVGLLDSDIYGPSIPLMMGVNRRPQAGPDGKIVPLTSYGIRLMSLGFLVDEATPVIWRGPMVQGVVRQFLHDVSWGELDYLLIDLPPGTGDAQLTLVQSVALSGAIIVTTPSDIALIDAAKGLNMFRTVEVPVFGVIENMSYFLCPHCNERTDIFSSKGGERVAEKLGAPFLGEIPLDTAIRQGGDEGKPIVAADPEGAAAAPFLRLARNVRERCEGGDGERAAKIQAEKKGFFSSIFSRS
jgi:ATP-binding protein involved in chromosome partitioning